MIQFTKKFKKTAVVIISLSGMPAERQV